MGFLQNAVFLKRAYFEKFELLKQIIRYTTKPAYDRSFFVTKVTKFWARWSISSIVVFGICLETIKSFFVKNNFFLENIIFCTAFTSGVFRRFFALRAENTKFRAIDEHPATVSSNFHFFSRKKVKKLF